MEFEESEALCDQYLKVLYPYGSLGPLSQKSGNDRIEFGDDRTLSSSLLSKNIRTFTESATAEYNEQAGGLLSNARISVFLGFGYHKQNIELLRPKAHKRGHRLIIGTAHQLSDRAKNVTENRLREAFWQGPGSSHDELKVELLNLKCREFMEEQRLLLVDG